MQTRAELVVQLARLISGEPVHDPRAPNDEVLSQADALLKRVELFLGADVEEAKEILTRVLEDVS
jgi:hypothetical protein